MRQARFRNFAWVLLIACPIACARQREDQSSTARATREAVDPRATREAVDAIVRTAVSTAPDAHADAQPGRPWEKTIAGQLERIDVEFRNMAVHPFKTQDSYLEETARPFAVKYADKLKRLRELSGIDDEQVDPRAVYYVAVENSYEQSHWGVVTLAMLRKNPVKHAGGTAWLRNARIVEIHESNGTTLARVTPSGERGEIAIVGRFESRFVEGDRVDVVGYHAGSFDYESRAGLHLSLPAVAAITLAKANGVLAMSKILPGFSR